MLTLAAYFQSAESALCSLHVPFRILDIQYVRMLIYPSVPFFDNTYITVRVNDYTQVHTQ